MKTHTQGRQGTLTRRRRVAQVVLFLLVVLLTATEGSYANPTSSTTPPVVSTVSKADTGSTPPTGVSPRVHAICLEVTQQAAQCNGYDILLSAPAPARWWHWGRKVTSPVYLPSVALW